MSKTVVDKEALAESKMYLDGQGRQVAACVQVYPPQGAEPKLFSLVGTKTFQHIIDGQMKQIEIRFQIDADSVHEAFEEYDAAADNAVLQWKEKYDNKSRIVAAGAMPSLKFPQMKR